MQVIRKMLCDVEDAVEFATELAHHAVRLSFGKDPHPQVLEFGEYFTAMLAENNVRTAHKYAESEIEKLFLCCLIFAALADPFMLHFTPPFPNGFRSLEKHREEEAARRKLFTDYTEAAGNDDLDGFISWLREAGREDGLTDADLEHIRARFVVGDTLQLEKAVYVSPQAVFPGVRVEGRAIRCDMFAWCPDDSGFRIAVECDGYAFHASREKFTSDRKRDRALREHGVDVLRYSGSEIFNAPEVAGSDCAMHLMRRAAAWKNRRTVEG